ncbi:MAG TPA: UvrD-helicase domain-containing protein, partial [Bacillota bacterium]|nr:UvrD-helicase domain-containing protein [Bacillota bacterium]
MKTELNQRQTEAVLEFQHDLLVTAGAGTGKTRVLTSKYLRLLEERRAGVAEIVAITFTKKAAAEMRERIGQGIAEHLSTVDAQGAGVEGEREFWEIQNLQLEKARIGTFHSFCLGLIREYPLEIGIPPVAGVFGEGEETIYLNQAIETVLTEVLITNPDSAPEREIVLQLLLEFGWESFQNSLGTVYQTIRESGIPFATVIASSIERLEKPATHGTIAELITEIEQLLGEQRVASSTERTREIIDNLRDNWTIYRELLLSENIGADVLPVLNELAGALPRNLAKPVKEQVGYIREIIDVLTEGLAGRLILPRLIAIGTLLNQVDQTYTGIKKTLGYLDFTDQLILARNLLAEHPQTGEEIRRGIRYLLVDEFQDTNGLQMELIALLKGNDSPSGRLMAVGDIKQSIYRFRGAESDLILKLAYEMKERQGRIIPLTQNYRSAPEVIQFVNGISAALFATESFEYEPLESGSRIPGPEANGLGQGSRMTEPEPNGLGQGSRIRSAGGAGEEAQTTVLRSNSAIEFIFTGAREKNAEAKMVAGRIQQLIAESADLEEPIHYSDIVILFRAKTAIPLFGEVFSTAGIPYYTCSGSGFYQCPEITDQLNLLRLTQQRYDGVALLNLLASPYVALSDESLFRLGAGENLVEQFWKAPEFPIEISTPERRRMYQFRDLVNELQRKRETLDIPSILRLAIERGNYREMLWAFPSVGQRVANLEKLLAKADEYVAKGFYDLHRFLAYIEKLDSVAVLEGEAPTQSEVGNVVRLMTIHRAKGLEFPVVFLPDLDRRFIVSDRRKIFFHKDIGLGFGAAAGDGEIIYPSITREIKERHRREEIAELKRVLYVALTRAKEQLILVGSGCNPSKGKEIETANNWMKWFELILPIGEDSSMLQRADGFIDFQGVSIKINRQLPELKKKESETSLLETYLQSGLAGISVPAYPLNEALDEVAVSRIPGLEPKELGQVSRIAGLGAKELGQVSWITGLETKELGQVSRIARLRTQELGQVFRIPGLEHMVRRRPEVVLQVSEILEFKTCGRYYYWRRKQDLAEPVSCFAPGGRSKDRRFPD